MNIVRRLTLALAAVFATAVGTPAIADGMTTAQLRQLCAAHAGTPARLSCAGYLTGFIDGAAMVATITGRLPWCTKNAEIEDVFLRYSKAHPGEGAQAAAVTIYFAMQEAYPCK